MSERALNARPLAFWEELVGWIIDHYDLFISISLWDLYSRWRRERKKPGRLIFVIIKDGRGRRFQWLRILPESCLWEMAQDKRIFRMVCHAPTVKITPAKQS